MRCKTTITNNNEASEDITAARQTYYSVPKHLKVYLPQMIIVDYGDDGDDNSTRIIIIIIIITRHVTGSS